MRLYPLLQSLDTTYFLNFLSTFPTVFDLANANEEQVLKLWQGLGYYSRARNLHFAAKSIILNKNGVFPATYEEIRALKGVGDYTAAAISSFAYDLPFAVVDGNVYRVLSRVFGIYSPIDTLTAKKEFQLLASQLLFKKDPATYNQAIMDLGATSLGNFDFDLSRKTITPGSKDGKSNLLQHDFAFLFGGNGDLPNLSSGSGKTVESVCYGTGN